MQITAVLRCFLRRLSYATVIRIAVEIRITLTPDVAGEVLPFRSSDQWRFFPLTTLSVHGERESREGCGWRGNRFACGLLENLSNENLKRHFADLFKVNKVYIAARGSRVRGGQDRRGHGQSGPSPWPPDPRHWYEFLEEIQHCFQNVKIYVIK